VFPLVVSRLGNRKTFLLGMAGSAPVYLLFPFVTVFLESSETLVFVLIIVLFNLSQFFGFFSMVSTFMMINNSNASYNRGKLHGLAMTVASITKFIAPFTISMIFAWSSSINDAIIDYKIAFFFLALLCIAASLLYFAIPSSIEVAPELKEPLLPSDESAADKHKTK
jgi:MFS family permease